MSEENVHEDIINEDNPITNQEAGEVEIEQPSTGTETSIPDRYQGKSVEEIIEMHRNAESALSRQGNELGETRKLIDHILQANPSPQQKDPEPVYDWDYEPDKAAQDLVSKEVGAVKKELDEMKRQTAIEKFKSKFPTFDSDSTSPEFIDWVQKSEYRTNLYNRNYNGVDLDAATELMLAWQDNKPAPADDSKRQEALKAASMEKGASSGGSRKKMWSRAYIRNLLKNDLPTYKANYDEIMAAYNEGRIMP